jgi:hypothetical protein
MVPGLPPIFFTFPFIYIAFSITYLVQQEDKNVQTIGLLGLTISLLFTIYPYPQRDDLLFNFCFHLLHRVSNLIKLQIWR